VKLYDQYEWRARLLFLKMVTYSEHPDFASRKKKKKTKEKKTLFQKLICMMSSIYTLVKDRHKFYKVHMLQKHQLSSIHQFTLSF
jgi:hypothetical protein